MEIFLTCNFLVIVRQTCFFPFQGGEAVSDWINGDRDRDRQRDRERQRQRQRDRDRETERQRETEKILGLFDYMSTCYIYFMCSYYVLHMSLYFYRFCAIHNIGLSIYVCNCQLQSKWQWLRPRDYLILWLLDLVS